MANANSNIRAHLKPYIFINARSNRLIIKLPPLRMISILATTEIEACTLLAGFPLVFASCKPLGELNHV
ncbi:hypothetical protein TI10_09860 [Photorhabdus luminescens subsp. luminescens]|uniref:Uncharacterized protein n=2 Tax=Photorhabdus TaxID=29487 RepID=A0A1G5R551_PHOLU|nr:MULTISPECIES: hypothetical protein [Photorhabdus]KMW73363.1 hypothetical protein TI10_09860 [Photorhabdus luminescens subsp. luminescens]MCA6221921.1 hypothetical protein [Photorhabdus antumapuensis]SCZ69213.1 hypothetical protein SAMN02982990_03196 [Photorhabdus luminescens]